MAVSASVYSSSLTLPRAAVHHGNNNLTLTNHLSFTFNLNPFKIQGPYSTLTLQHIPLPLNILCKRGKKAATQDKVEKPDPVYRNRLVSMVVNRVLKSGKKSLAYHIIYQALKRVQQKTGLNPLVVLRQAVLEVSPDVTVKSRRVGGSTQQVPVEVGATQGKALAIRWLLNASRKRSGKDMVFKLSSELMDAARGSGEAVRKKQETHKMAEANRAFAHYR